MADAVDTKVIYSGIKRQVTQFTSRSDGTGESGVIKIDISTYTNPNGQVATYMTIDFIEYSVWGFNYVALFWDHTTDDEAAVLKGTGVMDWVNQGGNTDPRTAGGTGDLLFTTNGGASGSGYDVTIHWRPKN